MVYLTLMSKLMEGRLLTGISTISLLTLLFLAGPSAHAGAIKCWTNNEGTRECGQSVPPEFSQQRVEIINERGIVVEVKEAAKTKEQLAEEARQKELMKIQQRRQKEQKRRDLILLSMFSTERDINLARSNRVDAIKSLIEITNGNTKTLKENLGAVMTKAADYERAGESPPNELLDDMRNLKRQIADNNDFVEKKLKDIDALDKRFEADLKRFRELKGITPPENQN